MQQRPDLWLYAEQGLHSEPEDGRYRSVVTLSYGHEVVLPEPVNVTLDTEALKRYAR